jgi:hypothetical protein
MGCTISLLMHARVAVKDLLIQSPKTDNADHKEERRTSAIFPVERRELVELLRKEESWRVSRSGWRRIRVSSSIPPN